MFASAAYATFLPAKTLPEIARRIHQEITTHLKRPDVQPISLLAATPYLLSVHPSLPVRSVKELIALAKARPGEFRALIRREVAKWTQIVPATGIPRQ